MRDFELNLTPEQESKRQYEYMEKAKELVFAKEKELGRKLTFSVVTFGCQMNARDSEKLVGILTEMGYVEVEDEHADFVVYNTFVLSLSIGVPDAITSLSTFIF